MPIQYRIDQEHSLVRLELSDPLDLKQIEEVVQRLLLDTDLQPGLNVLSDHSKLESTATTIMVKAIPPLVLGLSDILGSFRCAIVVPADASFGMARMAEAVVEGRAGPAQIRAFRSLGEAEAWLGTSPTA